jgi:hypothetical protein
MFLGNLVSLLPSTATSRHLKQAFAKLYPPALIRWREVRLGPGHVGAPHTIAV